MQAGQQAIYRRAIVTLSSGGGTVDTNGNTVAFANTIGNGGSGGFTKAGGGTLTLNGASTYTGATTVANGTLVLGSAGSFPANGALVMGDTGTNSGTLDLNGHSLTVSNLTNPGTGGSSQIGSGSATPANFTFTYAGNSATPGAFRGQIVDSVGSGNAQVVSLAVTSGKLTLTGASSYSGTTSISGNARLTLGTNGSLPTRRH